MLITSPSKTVRPNEKRQLLGGRREVVAAGRKREVRLGEEDARSQA